MSGTRRRHRSVGMLVALVIVSALIPSLGAPAAAQTPAQEAADLARQTKELTAQYDEAKRQLEARRGELGSAQSDFTAAKAVADAARAEQGEFAAHVDQLAAASFRGARFDSLAALLVSESPQQFLDQMSMLDLLAADNQRSLDALRRLVDRAEAAETTATGAAERAAGAEQQAAALEADLARRLEELKAKQLDLTGRLDQLAAADRDAISGYANGRIPASALCRANGDGPLLQCGAARAYEAMDAAFAASAGRPLCAGGGYRSYEEQVRLHAQKPGLTAAPGTSNHGWGLAVDMCAPGGGTLSFGSSDYAWLAANGPGFGWVNPAWARQGGGREEPWHWEHTG